MVVQLRQLTESLRGRFNMKNRSSKVEHVGDLTVCMVFDYSAVEIRFLAMISGDKLLIKQFKEAHEASKNPATTDLDRAKRDIHCRVGNTLTGWPIVQIFKDKDTRRSIKEFHFGIAYGIGDGKLYQDMRSKGVKTTFKQVKTYRKRYFQRYPQVDHYIRRMRRKVERDGYVETMFNFKCEIRQNDENRGSYWGNRAINSPIQGSAHQMVLIAMALLDLKPKTYNLLQCPVMEVHDALYFFVKLRDLPMAFKQAQYLLEQDVVQYVKKHFKKNLEVPLVSECQAGFCLGSMVDYGGEPVEEFLPVWRKKHLEVQAKPLQEIVGAALKKLGITEPKAA